MMKLEIKPGRYVAAVSGGVDSVTLLDLLSHEPGLDLTVAHFDHGIRSDSKLDRELVEELAKAYGLRFFYDEGKLGQNASEALAREKRYGFLKKVQKQTGARALITAHHQDDVIETAVINLLRGTGRRGLSSLRSSDEIVRPLLGFSKIEIIEYAKRNELQWREDSTNSDQKYLRNYVRLQIVPRLSKPQREQLLSFIYGAHESNQDIDKSLAQILETNLDGSIIDRQWFIGLPHSVAREVMASWLLGNNVELDKKRIEQMTLAAKILASGKKRDVDSQHILEVHENNLALVSHER